MSICAQIVNAIHEATGQQYITLADAIGWYAWSQAQAEDFTAEFHFKPGSKRPKTLFKHHKKGGIHKAKEQILKQILEAVNEMTESSFQTLAEVKDVYCNFEILDLWLRYEGITNYTSTILSVVEALYETDIDQN